MGDHRTLLIRPTIACDCTCDYCYVTKRSEYMSRSMVDLLVSRIREFLDTHPDDRLSCIWHGGEPSLMPLSFWEYAEEAFSGLDESRVSKSMQTNLLSRGLDKYRWLVDHGFTLSTSLDGPFEYHDQGRGIGRERYELLLHNIDTVATWGAKVGVICTVSRYHLGQADRLLAFFEQVGANVRFGKVDAKGWQHDISHQDYYRFLVELAGKWIASEDSQIVVDPIAEDIAHLVTQNYKFTCDRTPNCMSSFVSINPDGSLFPCCRFADFAEWMHGNLQQVSLGELWNRSASVHLQRLAVMLSECPECELYPKCGGGCKQQRARDTMSDRTDFCESIKYYFREIQRLFADQNPGFTTPYPVAGTTARDPICSLVPTTKS